MQVRPRDLQALPTVACDYLPLLRLSYRLDHRRVEQRPIIRPGERLIPHRPEFLLIDFPPLKLRQDDRPDQDLPSRVRPARLLGRQVTQPGIDPLLPRLELLKLAPSRLDLRIKRLRNAGGG